SKKVGRRKAIVLKNDTFFLMIKEPVDRGANSLAAAQIPVPKKCVQPAWPIHCGRNLPRLLALFSVFRPLAVAVCRDIKARRPRGTDGVHHQRRRIWPVEDEKQNWRSHHCVTRRIARKLLRTASKF